MNEVFEENKKQKRTQIEVDISEFIKAKGEEVLEFKDKLKDVAFGTESANYAYDLKKRKWYIVKYSDSIAVFWNSNKIEFDSSIRSASKFPKMYGFGDDLYAVYEGNPGEYYAFRLANGGKLNAEIESFYPQTKKFQVLEEESDIYGLALNYEPEESGKDWILVLLLFASLIFLFFYYLKRERIVLAVFTAILLIAVDLSFYMLLEKLDLETYVIYRAGIYASSSILSSLGVLINHLLTAIPLLFLIRYFRIRSTWHVVLRLLLYILVFFSADLVYGIVEGLVLDSTISFHFAEFYGISKFSFIAILIAGCLGFGLTFLINSSRISDDLKQVKTIWIVLAAAVGFILFQSIDAHRSLMPLLVSVLYVVLVAVFQLFITKERSLGLVYFFLVVFCASVIINEAQKERESNFIELYASKLVANQDLRAEYVLRSFEDRLAEEFLKPEDYDNFSIRRDVVEIRIKRLYFSNYLEKYELQLISFDSTGKNINDNNIYSFNKLDSIYNYNTKRTVSNYFYQINKPENFNGYMAKYENCDINGHYGTTFILLQPRLIQSEFLYPEVFANQKQKELVNMDDYSYGIYFNRKLISQKGSFQYSLQLQENWKDLVSNANHEHYQYNFDEFSVVLSKQEAGFKEFISVNTFTFLGLLPLVVLIILLVLLYLGKDNDYFQKVFDIRGRYLSTRIQFSLSVVLLVGILMSVYVIWIYIRSNYNENLENRLLTSIKNISTQFQNNINLEQKLGNQEARQLLLNEQSSAFNVDINLYNKDGQLLNSTKPYLLQDEILGSLMNPKAFYEMHRNKSSQLLLQEELEGSDYLSAYVPLFNAKNEVIAYLNTPYFGRNEELNKQISAVLINVLNVYFLIVIGGLLLAMVWSNRISKPLLLIRQKFAQTELGSANELIVYQRDDEIGQLVKQYNKMVLELEESANMLAEKEREGAWREMAKQVAHEIKNPLTPMKLSIQHLQRAFSSGKNVEDLFAKTCSLLIDQIESLSQMASEFSNFAKMPEHNPEELDLSGTLRDIVMLFERSENVKFKTQIADSVKVHADGDQLKRVFNNLIKNAVQAIPEDRDGIIEVSLKTAGTWAVIQVKDNGKGIDDSFKNKVFVPNFSTKNSGMGLGLAISRKIIESSGGEISFESVTGVGTTFKLLLPLYHEN